MLISVKEILFSHREKFKKWFIDALVNLPPVEMAQSPEYKISAPYRERILVDEQDLFDDSLGHYIVTIKLVHKRSCRFNNNKIYFPPEVTYVWAYEIPDEVAKKHFS